MERINEYAPVLTDAAISKHGGGFTILARDEYRARKLILQSIDEEDFEEIELFGSVLFDNWETQDRIENSQDGYY
jgi:hypothetical protein